MKKIRILLFICGIIFITSCGGSKQARTYRNSVAGNWQVQTIVAEGMTGKIKTQLLDEADFNCFIGSTWNFAKSNSLGYFSISKNGNECVAVKRFFRWSITDEAGVPNLLQFKKVDDRYKDIEPDKSGYRFTIVNISNSNMQLRSDFTFENKPAAFLYNFVKN